MSIRIRMKQKEEWKIRNSAIQGELNHKKRNLYVHEVIMWITGIMILEKYSGQGEW